MSALRALPLILAFTVACGSPLPGAAPPVQIDLDRPTLVTVGQTYRIASTEIEITPQRFTPLDTQAGHVLNGEIAATDGAVHEDLMLHAYMAAFRVPVIWHGLSLQLSETGFVYGGSSATLLITRAGATPPPPAPPPAPPPPPCVPPGLEEAQIVAEVVLPAGCHFAHGGSLARPDVVRTAEELAAAFTCEPGASPPAIDLGASELYLVEQMRSPAFGSGEVRDDGTVITFITRFRSPCPGDPRPMPYPGSFGFSLPRGATRTFGEATCSMPPRCD